MKLGLHETLLRQSALVVAIVATLNMPVAGADSVIDMCSKSANICECAASQFRKDAGDSSYGLYQEVGAAYIVNQAAGMGMGDAWDAAVRAEAKKRGESFSAVLKQTNALGKAHRKAIKNCVN